MSTNCSFCDADLNIMDENSKTLHLQKCLNKHEDKAQIKKIVEEKVNQIKMKVLDCPICGQSLKTTNSRRVHIKKCAAMYQVSFENLKVLLDKQQLDHNKVVDALSTTKLESEAINMIANAAKPKTKSKKRYRLAEPLCQLDEDTHLAIALSTSTMEESNLPINDLPNQKNAFTKLLSHKNHSVRPNKKAKTENMEYVLNHIKSEDSIKLMKDKFKKLMAERDFNHKRTKKICFPPSKLLAQYQCQTNFWDLTPSSLPNIYSDKLNKILPSNNNVSKMRQNPDQGHISNKGQLHETAGGVMVDQKCDKTSTTNKITDKRMRCSLSDFTNEPPISTFMLAGFANETCDYRSQQDKLLSSLAAELGSMLDDPLLSDLKIVCEDGQQIFVHKFIFAARCRAFYKEIANKSVYKWSECSSVSIRLILRYIYSSELPTRDALGEELLTIAKKLQLSDLSQFICDSLKQSQENKAVNIFSSDSNNCIDGNIIEETDRNIFDLSGDEINDIYEFVASQRALTQAENLASAKMESSIEYTSGLLKEEDIFNLDGQSTKNCKHNITEQNCSNIMFDIDSDEVNTHVDVNNKLQCSTIMLKEEKSFDVIDLQLIKQNNISKSFISPLGNKLTDSFEGKVYTDIKDYKVENNVDNFDNNDVFTGNSMCLSPDLFFHSPQNSTCTNGNLYLDSLSKDDVVSLLDEDNLLTGNFESNNGADSNMNISAVSSYVVDDVDNYNCGAIINNYPVGIEICNTESNKDSKDLQNSIKTPYKNNDFNKSLRDEYQLNESINGFPQDIQNKNKYDDNYINCHSTANKVIVESAAENSQIKESTGYKFNKPYSCINILTNTDDSHRNKISHSCIKDLNHYKNIDHNDCNNTDFNDCDKFDYNDCAKRLSSVINTDLSLMQRIKLKALEKNNLFTDKVSDNTKIMNTLSNSSISDLCSKEILLPSDTHKLSNVPSSIATFNNHILNSNSYVVSSCHDISKPNYMNDDAAGMIAASFNHKKSIENSREGTTKSTSNISITLSDKEALENCQVVNKINKPMLMDYVSPISPPSGTDKQVIMNFLDSDGITQPRVNNCSSTVLSSSSCAGKGSTVNCCDNYGITEPKLKVDITSLAASSSTDERSVGNYEDCGINFDDDPNNWIDDFTCSQALDEVNYEVNDEVDDLDSPLTDVETDASLLFTSVDHTNKPVKKATVDIPNYDSMATPMLKDRCQQYGVRVLPKKKKVPTATLR